MAAGENIVAEPPETRSRALARGRAGRRQARGSLRPVINATGVVIHTNLGRAPLAEPAIERIASIARGYSNLEYDLDERARADRAPCTPNR